MGVSISKLMNKVFGTKEMRLLMLGLDAAGKTTILYKLKLLDSNAKTIPTVGFNVETVEIKKTKFTLWDVGGQGNIQPLWRHYFSGTQALIFVVDSSDRERIGQASKALSNVLGDKEMEDVLLLVFANKQDLPGALTPQEVSENLQLKAQAKNRIWKVEPSCATTGEGLFEGLTWLSNNYQMPERPTK